MLRIENLRRRDSLTAADVSVSPELRNATVWTEDSPGYLVGQQYNADGQVRLETAIGAPPQGAAAQPADGARVAWHDGAPYVALTLASAITLTAFLISRRRTA